MRCRSWSNATSQPSSIAIHEHGGEISGTAGDGLLIIFHRVDPVSHSEMAAKTALSLMDVTEELTRTGLGPPVSVHIGISSGRAAVGSTRFEGLRGTRWVYSAEGFVTNLGSRLADLAEAGQILICPESARTPCRRPTSFILSARVSCRGSRKPWRSIVSSRSLRCAAAAHRVGGKRMAHGPHRR